MAAKNTKSNIFYSSKEYIATVVDTDTLAAGFYGTVFLNKGTAFTVTLGTAADNSEKAVKFINIGAGTVTISDGATVVTLAQYSCATVVCNGTDWYLSNYFQSYMTDIGTEINNRKLSVFNATSSSELAGVISDETGSGLLVFGTSPVFADKITIGTASGTTGYFELKGTTSGVVTVTVNDVAGTYTLTLPDNDGDADQVIATDGSGNLSWADNATSSGTAASFSETIGNGADVAFTITHNFSSRDIIVEVYEVASPYGRVYPEIEHTSVDTAVITFASAPTASQYRVVILKGGYALPTTSAELAAIISDETGTDKLVYSDSPEFTTNLTTEKIVVTTPTGYAEMYMYDNETACPIDATDTYHAVHHTFGNNDATLAPNIDTTYFTRKLGEDYTINSVDTYDEGAKIQCTVDAGHSLLEGEPVTITGSTNYDGAYLVLGAGLTATKFVVTISYVDDDTGSVRLPATLKCLVAGVYEASFSVSGVPSNPNDNFKWELNKDITPLDNIATRAIWTSATKYQGSGTQGLVSLTAGQYVWLSVKNYSGTGDLTISAGNVTLHRIL